MTACVVAYNVFDFIIFFARSKFFTVMAYDTVKFVYVVFMKIPLKE